MAVQHLLTEAAARASLNALREQRIHRTFPGYLSLRETRVRTGRNDLKADFKGFFDRYLAVEGGPNNCPYVVPFNDGNSTKLWQNRNVAGSYAASSLRDASPMMQVAAIFGSGAAQRFSLKASDASLCLEHMLGGQRIPVTPLAAFLLRDFAFIPEEENETPSSAALRNCFRVRFGFRADVPSEDADYNTLFIEEGFDEGLIQFERIETT